VGRRGQSSAGGGWPPKPAEPASRRPSEPRDRRARPETESRAALLDLEALHLLLRDVEVRVDALDVVEVLEGVGEAQHLLRLLALEPDGEARPHLERRLDRAEAPLLERALDRPELGAAGHDLDLVVALDDVVRPRVERGLEQRVRVEPRALEEQRALALEEVRDAAARAEVAAELGEDVPDLAGGAVAVVGERLDVDRGAAGAVALVDRLLPGLGVPAAGALQDRALDVVLGHVGGARLVHREAQPRVRARLPSAEAGRGRDLADQLGEDLPALRVEGALLAPDRRPFRVSRHRHP